MRYQYLYWLPSFSFEYKDDLFGRIQKQLVQAASVEAKLAIVFIATTQLNLTLGRPYFPKINHKPKPTLTFSQLDQIQYATLFQPN